MKQLGTGDKVSFVCDECEQHSPLAGIAYRNLKSTNPNAAAHMASFSSADEKECDPLQAADAVAFEIRRALNLELRQWPGSLRKQFEIVDDAGAVFIIQNADKANLLRVVAAHKPGQAFSLDAIMEQQFDANVRLRLRTN